MNYRSLGNFVIAISFLFLAAGVVLYYIKGGDYYWAILPGGLMLAISAILKIPIDEYWFRRHPPYMEEKLLKALQIEYPIIQSYNQEQQKAFSQKLAKLLIDSDGYLVMGETVELDTYNASLIGAPAIIMSLPMGDSYEHIEKLVAYKHAFPSPKRQYLHAAEMDYEDGVAIVSLEQMSYSLKRPDSYYHIVYHIWADHFVKHYTNIDLPKLPDSFRDDLALIFGFGEEQITTLLGYDDYTVEELSIVAYFTRYESLKSYSPEVVSGFDKIFK